MRLVVHLIEQGKPISVASATEKVSIYCGAGEQICRFVAVSACYQLAMILGELPQVRSSFFPLSAYRDPPMVSFVREPCHSIYFILIGNEGRFFDGGRWGGGHHHHQDNN